MVGRQVFDVAIEIVADTPDSPRVGFDGFGLEAAQFQTLFVFAIQLDKAGFLGMSVFMVTSFYRNE